MSIFVLALLAGVFGPSLLFRLFHVGGTNNKSVEAILSDFDAAEEAARPAEVSLRPSAQLPKPRPPESAVTDRSATVSTPRSAMDRSVTDNEAGAGEPATR